MQIENVTTEAIVVGERLRSLDEQKVDALAASMRAIGLQQPISCWIDEHDVPHLVVGLHRLAAAKKLMAEDYERWMFLPCVYVTLDEIDRRRWEIAENLHRADLTVVQRDEHVAEWIRLTDEAADLKSAQLAPKSKSETNPRGAGRKSSGINAASRELGVERTQAQRAIKVAGLSKEAKNAARAMSLDDNRSALLAAAKHEEPDEQVAELRRKAEERIARKTRTTGEVKDAMADAGEIIADAIAEFVPEGRLSAVTAALALRGLKDVAARVQSLTGAVFDKTPAGREMRRAS